MLAIKIKGQIPLFVREGVAKTQVYQFLMHSSTVLQGWTDRQKKNNAVPALLSIADSQLG